MTMKPPPDTVEMHQPQAGSKDNSTAIWEVDPKHLQFLRQELRWPAPQKLQ